MQVYTCGRSLEHHHDIEHAFVWLYPMVVTAREAVCNVINVFFCRIIQTKSMDYVEVSVEKFGDYLNAFSMILFGRWSKVKLTPNLVTFNTDNLPLALTRAQSVCQMQALSIRYQYLTVEVIIDSSSGVGTLEPSIFSVIGQLFTHPTKFLCFHLRKSISLRSNFSRLERACETFKSSQLGL